jgi:hypothetical protein
MVDPSLPDSPWYWPEHPEHSAFEQSPPNWIVDSIPPEPWPFDDYQNRPRYGPPGTVWIVPVDDYVTRVAHVPVDWLDKAVQWVLRQFKFVERLPPGHAQFYWRTPQERNMSTLLYRATIHGKYGTTEEMCNVMHFVPTPQGQPPLAEVTVPMVQAAADAVRDAWLAFLNTTFSGPLAGGESDVKAIFSSNLTFDEVRCAAVTLNGYNPPATARGSVAFNVPTQYSFFAPGLTGTNSTDNASEVACRVSFGTGQRGKSARGGIYLGPLGTHIQVGGGLFESTLPAKVGAAFLHSFQTPLLTATPVNLQLVVGSVRHGSALPVTVIRIGRVPDSQRRRRRRLVENYVTAV